MPSRDIRDMQQGEGGEGSLPPEESSLQGPFSDGLIVPPLSMQRTIVNIVLEDFQASKTARDEQTYGKTSKGEDLTYDKWLQELKDLYFGNREPKTTPWRYCSNRSLMIGMAILETLHARMFPAVYNEDLTRWKPQEATDVHRTDSVEKVMFWWIRVRSRMRDFFDKWTRHVIGFGRVLSEQSFDVQLIDRGEMSDPQQIPNPDGTVQTIDPEKVLERLEKAMSTIVPDEDIFLLPGATDIQRDTVMIRKKFLFRDLEELEAQGKMVNVTQSSDPDIQPLKDLIFVPGMPEVGALTPEETSEIKRIKLRNQMVEVICWWGSGDMDQDGFSEPVRILVNEKHRLYLGGTEIAKMSKRGLRHLDITLYMARLDDPHGLRGIGVLEQIKELALEIDAIFNQLTDANTLQVLKPGFYDPGGDMNAADLKIAPNKWSPVSNPQQSIFVPEMNIQTERLVVAIRTVLEFIERLTASSAYVMGKESEIVGGSGTATRTNAIVSAANERHGIPAERLREGVARIITQHFDLLQANLPPGLENRILGPNDEKVFSNPVSIEALAGDFDCFLLPDDSMGSKEAQRQMAQLFYGTLTQNLIVATDPYKLYRVTADWVKAFGKDPITYLGAEPPNSTPTSPEEEHQLMVQGDFQRVVPNVLQNPIEHIMKHMALPNDPALQTLPPALAQQVLEFNQMHVQQHMQQMQMMMAAMGKQKGGGSQGAGTDSGGADQVGGRPAQAVGPEPGVGSGQSPLSQALSTRRNGESASPAGG